MLSLLRSLFRQMIQEGSDSSAADSTSIQLAMASYNTNSKVVWDSNKMTIVDNPEATKLLACPYRAGYKRPQV